MSDPPAAIVLLNYQHRGLHSRFVSHFPHLQRERERVCVCVCVREYTKAVCVWGGGVFVRIIRTDVVIKAPRHITKYCTVGNLLAIGYEHIKTLKRL